MLHVTKVAKAQEVEDWNLKVESWGNRNINVPCKITYSDVTIVTTDTLRLIGLEEIKIFIELDKLRKPITYEYQVNKALLNNFEIIDLEYMAKIITSQKNNISKNPLIVQALIKKKYQKIKLTKVD